MVIKVLKILKTILMTGGLSLILAVIAIGDVIPTSVWCDFYGSASTYNDNPIPVGSVIDVYDIDGVHCGTFTVHTDGHYGLMPVYGDDGYSEGPTVGEALTFYLNGRLAVVDNPSAAVYQSMGSRTELNLSASAAVSMEPVTAVDVYEADPGDTVTISMMVKNTGEGLDFYTVSADTEHGWITKPMFGFVYALPDEAVTVEFDVYVPVAIFYDLTELVDFRVQSGTDVDVYIDRQVEIQVLMPTDVGDEPSLLPGEFRLEQNYPNPFNPGTFIGFELPKRAEVEIEVFNLLGQTVRLVNLGYLEAGNHGYDFNAENLASGIYFYRLRADEFSDVRKMVLMK